MRIVTTSILAVLLISVFSSIGVTATSALAAQCEFVLGFKIVHDLIPDVVGDCLAPEHYAANGDGLQETSHGLLVWRKADNFTAFTDGYNTWVYGPLGLQQRLNTERFPWENDGKVAGATAANLSPIDEAMIAYLDWTFENQANLELRMERVGLRLQGLVETNCTCAADPVWRAEMTEALADLKITALEMQQYAQVPEPALELNHLSIAVGKALATFADEFTAAMNDEGIDVRKMVLSLEHLTQVDDDAEMWYDLFWELDAKYY